VSTVNFGNIKNIMLFGGGKLLLEVALLLEKGDFNTFVVTSKRHAENKIDNHDSFEQLLQAHRIHHVIANDLSEIKELSNIDKNTMGLSISATWLFTKEFIHKFGGRLLNAHCSRLPTYRGGGGFSWMIMNRETTGAVLIHQIEPGIDTGSIVKYEEIVFPPSCRKPIDYQNYTHNKYIDLFNDFINQIRLRTDFNLIHQQELFSTYFPRLNTDVNGFINWQWNAEEIEVFICAFDSPYQGASTFTNGNRVRLKDCYLIRRDCHFHPFQTGIVYKKSDDGCIYIAGRNGSLLVKNITDEKNTVMMSEINLGDRFYTPIEYIEKALSYRVVYTADGPKKGD